MPGRIPRPDLTAVRQRLLEGRGSATEEMEESIRLAASPACEYVFLRNRFEQARAIAGDPARRTLPLAGLAFSAKDLFDVAGEPTLAGSRILADAAPAVQDSPAVARLQAAGGALLGRTNMTEFAFSGVGINPHYGTPSNPADPQTPRVPGGSSSGAAVSVATGAAFIGLGSDTGGSIRIPAALCGIVGFKNTARLTPREGALPLSTTLDTVCAMTRTVRDAIVAHEVLAGRHINRSDKPLREYRLAVPQTGMLDGLDAAVSRGFERAVQRLRAEGAQVIDLPLTELRDLGTIQATGGFSAAESYAWHRALLAVQGSGYDPRVRTRIERGANMKAYEYIELIHARHTWISQVDKALAGIDALLSPTVPIVAPLLEQVAPGRENDDAFFAANTLLLRNPSVVNMLDGCAISIPCHAPGELPTGLMIWHSAMRDDTILNIALQAESALGATTGTR